ncbi:predicted protein [Nematostella vectensis]|uniref:Proline-rich transmembrane protein 3/4 domain-containing protein n=2 Tax=Nematostella vectensis TaxID=45351 RepID=A7RR19_NEMVE|nr:predicted protein [Nematostella vectensis]|eukprot:XP_001638155.1 predicted protein [Nematostella vectensis]
MVSLVLLALGTVYGTARGISLCIDAYSHKKALPAFVENLLWGIAQPCLVTGYTLFFIVVRNALTLKGRFQAWFTTRNILLVGSLPYLGIVIISELLVTFAPSHAIVSFVCQLIYTVINFALSLFYFTLARQLNFKFGTNNRAAQRASGRRMVFFRCACVAVAAGGLALSAAQVYAMSGEFSVFSRARFVAAWPWFGFNTAVRVLELYLSVVLLVLASYQGNRSAVEEAREGN